MIIQKCPRGDTHELVLAGRCDGDGANQLEVELLATIATGAKHITVEMSSVTFICSTGLRTLLQYWRQMRKWCGSLQFARPYVEAMTVLGTSGLKYMLIART